MMDQRRIKLKTSIKIFVCTVYFVLRFLINLFKVISLGKDIKRNSAGTTRVAIHKKPFR